MPSVSRTGPADWLIPRLSSSLPSFGMEYPSAGEVVEFTGLIVFFTVLPGWNQKLGAGLFFGGFERAAAGSQKGFEDVEEGAALLLLGSRLE